MNGMLLRGFRRPTAAFSRSSLYSPAVRCQSSEAEQVSDGEHKDDFEEHTTATISGDVSQSEVLPHTRKVGNTPAKDRASGQLPWSALTRTVPPPKAQQLKGSREMPGILSRSRPGVASAESDNPWDRTQSLMDKLPGKSGVGSPAPQPARPQLRRSADKLGRSRLEALTNTDSYRQGSDGQLNGQLNSRLNSELNGAAKTADPAQGLRGLNMLLNRRPERRSAQVKGRPPTSSNIPAAALPWSILGDSKARKTDLHLPGQRETMVDLMGPNRYGGSPALHRGQQGATRRKPEVNVVAKEVQIPAVAVSVGKLALVLAKKTGEVMRMLRDMGEAGVSTKMMVDPDTAEMVASEFGLRTKRLKIRDGDVGLTTVTEASFDSLAPRPAVVSVMGHVDHGKTTLLDALRDSKVAGTEAAGITQKIGAFSVEVNDSSVTFFDTPGHAAFKSMRQSTSRLTDIVLLVVAADDGVKSQTIEVLQLLKEFPNLAPVIAVTKIDRYGVDAEGAVDRISRQLLEHSIMTEGYGGQVPIVSVSAVSREGFDDLLDTLMLQAEILELRADDKAAAEGVVVDSCLVQGKGCVADVLVTWGKLKVGDVVVAGTEYGKVRTLSSSHGKAVREAGAAEPVRIVGMKGLPKMGGEMMVVESESRARAIVAQRQKQLEMEELEQQAGNLSEKRVSEEAAKRLKIEAKQAIKRREFALFKAREASRAMKSRRDDASKQAAEVAEQAAAKAMEYAEEAVRRAEMQGEDGQDDGPAKCFAIFKAEGFGMLEAMSQVTEEVPQEEVELNLLRKGVGPVTQSDIEAAALAEAPIFAFNTGDTPSDLKAMAQRMGVQIYCHDVIYRFLDDMKIVMSKFLPPDMKETLVGQAKTLEVFDTTGKNKETVVVAGLAVTSGKLSRSHFFRVVRGDDIIANGLKAGSMRRFKDRVNEVTKDKECGVALEGFGDFQKDDVVQCYTLEEISRTM